MHLLREETRLTLSDPVSNITCSLCLNKTSTEHSWTPLSGWWTGFFSSTCCCLSIVQPCDVCHALEPQAGFFEMEDGRRWQMGRFFADWGPPLGLSVSSASASSVVTSYPITAVDSCTCNLLKKAWTNFNRLLVFVPACWLCLLLLLFSTLKCLKAVVSWIADIQTYGTD